jgi:hypothetical protein
MRYMNIGLFGSVLLIFLVIGAFVKGGSLLVALGIGVVFNVAIYLIWAFFMIRGKEHKNK